MRLGEGGGDLAHRLAQRLAQRLAGLLDGGDQSLALCPGLAAQRGRPLRGCGERRLHVADAGAHLLDQLAAGGRRGIEQLVALPLDADQHLLVALLLGQVGHDHAGQRRLVVPRRGDRDVRRLARAVAADQLDLGLRRRAARGQQHGVDQRLRAGCDVALQGRPDQTVQRHADQVCEPRVGVGDRGVAVDQQRALVHGLHELAIAAIRALEREHLIADRSLDDQGPAIVHVHSSAIGSNGDAASGTKALAVGRNPYQSPAVQPDIIRDERAWDDAEP